MVVPGPCPGTSGWSCAPGGLMGMGIALSSTPVFRRDGESTTQPERKEEGKMEGRKGI